MSDSSGTPPAPDIDASGDAPATRGSGLAAISALLGVLGLAGCLVTTLATALVSAEAMWGLVITGSLSLLAFVLGLGALLGGGKPVEGEKPRGRSAAVLGTFAGLIGTVLQGSVVVGGLIQFVPLQTQVVPRVDAMLVAGRQGNATQIRRYLAEPADQAIDDEDLLAYFEAIERAAGSKVIADVDLGVIGASRDLVGRYAQTGTGGGSLDRLPKIIQLKGANETLLMAIVLDEDALADDLVKVLDAIVFLPDHPNALILRRNGPAEKIAVALGARRVDPASVR